MVNFEPGDVQWIEAVEIRVDRIAAGLMLSQTHNGLKLWKFVLVCWCLVDVPVTPFGREAGKWLYLSSDPRPRCAVIRLESLLNVQPFGARGDSFHHSRSVVASYERALVQKDLPN